LCSAAVGAVAQAQTPAVPPPVSPPAAPAPPEPLRLAVPMSQRLILVRGPSFGGSFKFDRGGITLVDSQYAGGLDLALAGSDRAVFLARQAHGDLVTGSVLTWTGVGLILVSLVGGIALAAAYAPADNGPTSPAYNAAVAGSFGGLLVGVVLDLAGIPFRVSGTQEELDAVNAYNSDLVDGRLRAGVAIPGS